jgi:guanosine-3',5'-bis(diphosphate) 3'-pyrophosphohydrolase
VAAALLHDTIEDTPTTAEELATEFGPTVASVVTELNFPAEIPSRRAEIVKALPGFSERAKLIMYANAMANIADIPNSGWDAERLKRYANFAATIITALYRDVT